MVDPVGEMVVAQLVEEALSSLQEWAGCVSLTSRQEDPSDVCGVGRDALLPPDLLIDCEGLPMELLSIAMASLVRCDQT